MITRQDIVMEARRWIGTRYRHQGRTRGVGVDCIGLVGGVAVSLGLPGAGEWLTDRGLHNYARTPNPTTLLAGCLRYMDQVPAADVGDVLLFSVENYPRHFALVSEVKSSGEATKVIHAYALLAARRVVEQSLPIAKTKILAAYGFRGIEA